MTGAWVGSDVAGRFPISQRGRQEHIAMGVDPDAARGPGRLHLGRGRYPVADVAAGLDDRALNPPQRQAPPLAARGGLGSLGAVPMPMAPAASVARRRLALRVELERRPGPGLAAHGRQCLGLGTARALVRKFCPTATGTVHRLQRVVIFPARQAHAWPRGGETSVC